MDDSSSGDMTGNGAGTAEYDPETNNYPRDGCGGIDGATFAGKSGIPGPSTDKNASNTAVVVATGDPRDEAGRVPRSKHIGHDADNSGIGRSSGGTARPAVEAMVECDDLEAGNTYPPNGT